MLFAKQIENTYRNQLYVRNDDTKDVFYFSHLDFKGLIKDEYTFDSPLGHKLVGAFYYYENYIPTKLIIFDHGLGGGHRSYMREIEKLASFGYRVFAYDHTGCMESGGENTNGFAQSLNDLNACVEALKKEDQYKDLELMVMGHSWGAFSTMNIVKLHPEISHIVAISGFIDTLSIVEQNFSGLLKAYIKHILEIEEAANPHFFKYSALNSLKDYKGQALLVYSDDDPVVKKEKHYDPLFNEFKDSPNIHFLLMEGKGHNPNYTKVANAYKDEFFKELTKHRKAQDLKTVLDKQNFIQQFDWYKMTEQDEEFWQVVQEFLSHS